MSDYKYKKYNIFIIIFLIFFGSILRIYNINYDDLWSDEMVSFWIADPNISFSDTMNRIFNSNWMVLYEICLKYFHLFFGYDVNVSRYFSVIISIGSLILFGLLLNKITTKKSVILGLFILSINIYHLSYSIELRSYILSFFMVNLFIYFVFRENFDKKFFLGNLIILNFILILMLLSHPFTLLVVGSYIVYNILKNLRFKSFDKTQFIKIFSLVIVSCLFLIFYFQTTLKMIDPNVFKGISPDWMWQVKPSFYTNFYFSKFFGSRIMGLLHLLVFIGCIITFYKNIFKEFNIFAFFLILIFF